MHSGDQNGRDPLPREGHLSQWLAGAALLVSMLWFYIQLKEWQQIGPEHDYMSFVFNVLVTLTLWALLITAAVSLLRGRKRYSAEIAELRKQNKTEAARAEENHTLCVPEIGGEILRVRLNSHGSIFRGSGDRLAVCELGIDLMLQTPEAKSIEIKSMMITAWPCSNVPVKMLSIHSDLGIPFDLRGSLSFSVKATIEFLKNGSKIPAFLVMLVDHHNAKHLIPLRSGAKLPDLPNTVTS